MPLNLLANLKLAANPSSGTIGSTAGLAAGGNAFDTSFINIPGFSQNQKNSSHQKSSYHKPGVTKNDDGVTKLDFDNRSRSSDNHEPLQDHGHRNRDKKHKKKKKNKRSREEKEKRKSKRLQNPMALFPGAYPASMMGANVDDLAASFDFFQSPYHATGRMGNPGIMDMLSLTNQKNSGSKIYPGFYDHMHHSKTRSKDMQLGQQGSSGILGPVGGHTCSASGAYQGSHFPGYMF